MASMESDPEGSQVPQELDGLDDTEVHERLQSIPPYVYRAKADETPRKL